MDESWDADWENIATHARFTSNPDKNITVFRPEGLKRLEMLLPPIGASASIQRFSSFLSPLPFLSTKKIPA
jgi:hypothetical protein